MDGFSRLNASGRLSGEWDMKQICNRGCWRTGKYIIFFTPPQMFIRRHCAERRSEGPDKTLKAPQHASRISIHFNSFLSDSLLVRKSPSCSIKQPLSYSTHSKVFRKLGGRLHRTALWSGAIVQQSKVQIQTQQSVTADRTKNWGKGREGKKKKKRTKSRRVRLL